MRILVTGSAGFIARHVSCMLMQRGHEVHGVDSFVVQVHGSEAPRPAENEVRSSVGNYAAQYGDGLWDKLDCVVHLAAAVGVGQSTYQPVHYVRNNVLETVQLWERLIQHRATLGKVIVASSMSVFGEGAYRDGNNWCMGGLRREVGSGWDIFRDGAGHMNNAPLVPLPTPETKLSEPASVYAQTKYDTERYSLLLGEAYHVPTIALRLFGTYGEGQALSNPYTGVVAAFACRVLNGKRPQVYEDGLQSRDFIHVNDVAEAVCAAVEDHEMQSGVYNVGTGTATTLIDLAHEWCRIAAEHGLPSVLPEILNTYRVGDIRHCFADASKLRKATGWHAQIPLSDGLRRLAKWLLETGAHKTAHDRLEMARAELQARGLER